MKKLLIILLCLPLITFAQKGYGKIDAGALIVRPSVYPALAMTVGLSFKQPGGGVGLKAQLVKDFGFLLMGDLHGFIPIAKGLTFAPGFNPGVRVYKGTSSFVFGADGAFVVGQNKTRPFLSIGVIFAKSKIANNTYIKSNLFYTGVGVLF